jgi:hypothetical protein
MGTLRGFVGREDMRRVPSSSSGDEERRTTFGGSNIIIIHLLGLAPAGYLAASDNGA